MGKYNLDWTFFGKKLSLNIGKSKINLWEIYLFSIISISNITGPFNKKQMIYDLCVKKCYLILVTNERTE